MLLLRCIVALIAAARMLCAQPDPTQLMLQAREKLLNAVRRLPKYTCLETIDRSYYVAPREKPRTRLQSRTPLDSCSLEFQIGEGNFVPEWKDRLRLEVAIAEKNEIHSWPAASRFDTRTIDQMIPVGPTSSGVFGGLLVDIFNNSGTKFRYVGRIGDGQREVFEYTFRVPLEASHYSVNIPGGRADTGYQGSFRIDTKTAELIRVVDETERLPPGAAMCRAKTSTDYRFTLLGDGQILLPVQSVLETQRPNAFRTSNVTTFSACHEYVAQSTIRFGDEDEIAKAAANAPRAATPLPAGIMLTLALTDAIDTSRAAGGDPVSAKVTKAVRASGSNTILVPAGAIARGRILQMRHNYANSQFMILIRFDTLESQGAVSPLSVRLTKRPARAGFGLLPIPLDDTGSSFTISSKGEYVMKAGFESDWITVP
jgi:hypothetical protein